MTLSSPSCKYFTENMRVAFRWQKAYRENAKAYNNWWGKDVDHKDM